MNKVIITGNLTRDPELKSLPSGQKVANFSVATNRYWTDKTTNERKEATEYHNIVVFGRQAETTAQYLKKGSQAMIEGRLQTRSWDDATSGQKRYRTEIMADRVQFGSRSSETGGGNASAGQQNAGPAPESGPASNNPEVPTDSSSVNYPEEESNPEDIPF